MGEIRGESFIWDSRFEDQSSPISVVTDGKLDMELGGGTHTAVYEEGPPALLHWSDGEVWTRELDTSRVVEMIGQVLGTKAEPKTEVTDEPSGTDQQHHHEQRHQEQHQPEQHQQKHPRRGKRTSAAEEEELIGIYRAHVRRRVRQHDGDAEAVVRDLRAKYPRAARRYDREQAREQRRQDRNETGR